MEVLAYSAIALMVILCGIWSARYTNRRYDFEIFTFESVGLTLIAFVTWVLAYFLYRPGTAEEQWVEILAGLFVLGAGLIPPVYLLVKNVRNTNLFWGLVAFLYQLLFVASIVLLVLLIFIRLNDD